MISVKIDKSFYLNDMDGSWGHIFVQYGDGSWYDADVSEIFNNVADLEEEGYTYFSEYVEEQFSSYQTYYFVGVYDMPSLHKIEVSSLCGFNPQYFDMYQIGYENAIFYANLTASVSVLNDDGEIFHQQTSFKSSYTDVWEGSGARVFESTSVADYNVRLLGDVILARDGDVIIQDDSNVILNAMSAVTDLLQVEVYTGLTLGTIAFVPVLTGLVFFFVKFLR